ncbi:bifunctional riboflavin kinase/FAD synthetase [Alienimonas californiensis]|uniref:Riboflavin biosynthesis protein n=1 Tax=Alienimonas californiensis TaxID=2527989 RepID=A0A517P9G1_9PLAN|nr:bifunctional riboflavin kinase/FAD synthetase [Alienimonas californiensis]QDT16008.1 Riboflavin kinase [Alienimonas californiensis]
MARADASADPERSGNKDANGGAPADWTIAVPPEARGGLLSVGNFDGVHRGHAAILSELKRLATKRGVPAVAVTFDPHPVAVLRPEFAPALLTTHDRRAELLRAGGADAVVRLPVDRNLLAHSAGQFFERVLLGAFGAVGVVEGGDFRFGKDRVGDVSTLRRWGRPHGWTVETVDAVSIDDAPVSSSRIRALIAEGELTAANRLLGRPHRLAGTVVTGEGRGRTLGFPTANLSELDVLPPAPGVYAGRTTVDGVTYPVALHLGPRPTFDAGPPTAEAHLLDFQGDLYGRRLAVELLDRVRGVRAFADADELKRQVRADVAKTRQLVMAAPQGESG